MKGLMTELGMNVFTTVAHGDFVHAHSSRWWSGSTRDPKQEIDAQARLYEDDDNSDTP